MIIMSFMTSSLVINMLQIICKTHLIKANFCKKKNERLICITMIEKIIIIFYVYLNPKNFDYDICRKYAKLCRNVYPIYSHVCSCCISRSVWNARLTNEQNISFQGSSLLLFVNCFES